MLSFGVWATFATLLLSVQGVSLKNEDLQHFKNVQFDSEAIAYENKYPEHLDQKAVDISFDIASQGPVEVLSHIANENKVKDDHSYNSNVTDDSTDKENHVYDGSRYKTHSSLDDHSRNKDSHRESKPRVYHGVIDDESRFKDTSRFKDASKFKDSFWFGTKHRHPRHFSPDFWNPHFPHDREEGFGSFPVHPHFPMFLPPIPPTLIPKIPFIPQIPHTPYYPQQFPNHHPGGRGFPGEFSGPADHMPWLNGYHPGYGGIGHLGYPGSFYGHPFFGGARHYGWPGEEHERTDQGDVHGSGEDGDEPDEPEIREDFDMPSSKTSLFGYTDLLF
jgi:hypothetical protein